MRPLATLIALTLPLTFAPEAVAYCVGQVTEILSFDAGLGELPEGVAVDIHNNRYVSVATTGEILKISPYGKVSTYAQIDTGPGYLLGITTSGAGTLYVALASFTPGTQGIYKVSPGGETTMIAAFDAASTLPDGVALDFSGNLYVTEAIGGAIHRINTATNESELWLQDDLLVGDLENSPLPFPVGANGIAVDGDSLVVSNTQMGRLVRIPIDCDGFPEEPVLIVEDPQLHGADGLALDYYRNIYLAVNDDNTVVRVSPEGEIETIIDADDGLDFPASVAFGRGSDRRNLYITNFAFYSGANGNPALLKAHVGAPGLWLP